MKNFREYLGFGSLIILSQIFGAIFGCLWALMTAVTDEVDNERVVLTPFASIRPNISYYDLIYTKIYFGKVLLIELFGTFMFVSCCLAMSHQGSKD